jgi:hypothetical protein
MAVLCLFGLLATTSLAAEQGRESAQQGLLAFKSGEYRQALEYFLQAERAGNSSESLQYNIAVSFYRLKRYRESETRFMKLVGLAKWRPLVHYNLGLLAEAQGDVKAAKKWFERGAAQQQYEKLRLLSEQKLKQLAAGTAAASADEKNAVTPAARRNWMALFNVSMGNDSNAASLAGELVEDQSNARDTYSEWLAYAQTYLNGKAGDGLKLYGLGFNRRYSDFDHLNSQVMGAGLAREFPLGAYKIEAGVRLTYVRVNAERLANQVQGKFELSRASHAGAFSLAYLPSRFFASDDFEQIDGWQHRLEAEWVKRFEAWTFKARYRFESNNRDDLRRGESFASYSPERNSIKGQLDWKLSDNTDLGFSVEHIRSSYDDENRLRDTDGEIKQAPRSTEQLKFSTGLRYRWNRHWRVKGEYEYVDTKDNFDLYTYDKNRISAALEYQF